ncbi:TolC family protein [Arachidicoccus ginsenosidivorans]|jgi:outer membrane protein TolC|uniref:TolC family protein n=1 Tax=Arachidicoccus ginsenosidivorans TaxID=496057 RepID=A0A5B8VI81_9BACT|nr:TolC family protein [Arachidicoccus ginsenosidivorans]QEC70999.1 TolC family protein [Arachidicoccus ginsenosidivorans]
MRKYICFLGLLTGLTAQLKAQQQPVILDSATVENCVQYAMEHYPVLKQSYVNQEITNSQIKGKLADWYPQINMDASYQHYFQLPTTLFNGAATKSGVRNSSGIQFGLTQNIFNRDALLASSTKDIVKKSTEQDIEATKIDVAVNVSKAFYDVLLTQKQILVLDEDIIRLKTSLKDATNQYKGGIVDNIDYKRATISLNNVVAQRRSNAELLKAKYANLKQLMGYPADQPLSLHTDSTALEGLAMIDTTQTVNVMDRIEYQQLKTQEQLQQANLKYEKWSFIPTLSAFANYNLSYMNQDFGKLYNTNYPNSFVGLQLGVPIFQGGKRKQNIRQASLQIDLVKLNEENFLNAANTQFETAMAVYKSDLNTFLALKENVELAKEVYNTITLQYKAGVKIYLDVITAETDLRSAQVNYSNALYQLLSDKLDVEQALGQIHY